MRRLFGHKNDAPEHQVQDRWVFGGLLLLLVWAPLPLGSNRIWAIGILLFGAVALLRRYRTGLATPPCSGPNSFVRVSVPHFTVRRNGAADWAQTVPLPAHWVEALSPVAAAAQGKATNMTLSVDVFQSQLMAGLSFAYLCVFLVVVLCVRTASRLDRLAQVLVWSGVLQNSSGCCAVLSQSRIPHFLHRGSHTPA